MTIRDEYVGDRQTLAQLLRRFLARERDPRAAAGVADGDLDALYHEYTDLDVDGESARQFRRCLDEAASVFELVAPVSTFATAVESETHQGTQDRRFCNGDFLSGRLASPAFCPRSHNWARSARDNVGVSQTSVE